MRYTEAGNRHARRVKRFGETNLSVDGRTWHDSARDAHTAARKG